MIDYGSCRRRGSAVRWVLALVVIGGLLYAFRGSFSGMLKSEASGETPRGAIELFTQGLIERNEAAVLAQCEAGAEEQGRQALSQLNQIVDSHQMSKPNSMTINSGRVGQQPEVGKQVTAQVVIVGENRDRGANLTVTVELQADNLWKVVEASVTTIDNALDIIDY